MEWIIISKSETKQQKCFVRGVTDLVVGELAAERGKRDDNKWKFSGNWRDGYLNVFVSLKIDDIACNHREGEIYCISDRQTYIGQIGRHTKT